ncbi:MAG: hypothetical protein A4E35_00106 [Methanoregula sp. PtaU1.Bin051]|nr:MAG: hypothetical protein A4E35_00106 [Methanoregula sp. PtaU1.Bin051]
MLMNSNSCNDPVLDAAKMALKTGNVNIILPWIPKSAENKMKNLFEKTLCEQRIGNDMNNVGVKWYFRTVRQLNYSFDRALPKRK